MKQSRRSFLASAAAATGALATGGTASAAPAFIDLPMANGRRPLEKFPQKREMIVQATRPPILETPFSVFDGSELTPNDAHYVRWHLAGIPESVDASTFQLKVGGLVNKSLSLSLAQLERDFPATEIVAVNECSGNSRGYFSPRVPGGEWSNGGMSNARWRGVRLKDILAKAGIASGAKQVSFHGLDRGVIPATPQFTKALDMDVAAGDDVIVAYAMNGQRLPLLNGFPLRLVVAGWFATYWVKMLSNIDVIDHVEDSFWMKTAYRIPDTPGNTVTPDQTGYPTIPINKLRVRSFITNVTDGERLKPGPQPIRGIAFDSGTGIKTVEFSSDGGTTWTAATLGRDLGRYSFRKWQTTWTPSGPNKFTLACRAASNGGETQSTVAVWNPSGYLRNNIETYQVNL
ncbi:MAG: molybdopterin-dependent oxidoreductase [Candidatus Eremiobacteraeota bacterium]|nr:molybdopterin-dependent oxidoreductase [Candidatus Eremiobacteraeota bacterium]